MKKKRIIIATIKTWNIDRAEKFSKEYYEKYETIIISNKDELSVEKVDEFDPDYIFFPHWSWYIPSEIHEKYNCILFHMTDLPYGRGGSPLQNLIVREEYTTKISAIEVEEEVDSGKIYMKEPFNISRGSAEEIFIDMSEIIFKEMIPKILKENPVPKEQEGEPTYFDRRKPTQSNLLNAEISSLQDIFDFVRMLDAEGYPKAFIKLGDFKIEFSKINKKQDKLRGNFEITKE